MLAVTTGRVGAGHGRRPGGAGAAEAVDLAERAVALTGRQDARALDVLAVALASAGRFDEAVAAAREALGKATPPLTAAIAARVTLFERREAFVDRR